MKKKTSLSIDEKVLCSVTALAQREDRSVSYVIEKIAESVGKVAEESEQCSVTLKDLAQHIEKLSKDIKKK